MSRCFPFPPPGYEKKARTDEVDLLTKEKHKEKKHKKEKDKKREGREKKDKERSKDKHKEKKDRKEKHKDKKKDKDREKDKKKGSDEKRIEGYSGGKSSEISQQPGEIKGSKFVEDLGRRIGDEEGTRSQTIENLSGTDPRRIEGMGRVVEKYSSNKIENLIGTDQRNTEGMGQVVEKHSNSKVENLIGTDQRNAEGVRVVDKNFSTRVENLTGTDQRRAEGMGRVVEKDFNNRVEGKEINNSRKLDGKKAAVQRSQDGGGGMGNEIVQNISEMDQRRTGSMDGLMEKDAEKIITGKEREKNKSKGNDDKQGDKHKNREKKGKGQDKDKDKEKKKEKEKEKLKEKGDPKNNKQDKLRDSSKDPPLDTLNIKPLQIPKDSDISAATEGNHRKRKDLETNGFLHDNDIRPNKLLKPTVSSHPLMENGRKLEPFQIATQSASDRHGTGNNLKAENKERKVNGIIEAPGSSSNSAKSSIASLHIGENGGASTKPPHPDSKYLNQILAVPKLEEWSDFDDQEWLFSSNNLQTKKPKVVSSGVEERPQVWAEAIRIESADVCALPYVIPY